MMIELWGTLYLRITVRMESVATEICEKKNRRERDKQTLRERK